MEIEQLEKLFKENSVYQQRKSTLRCSQDKECRKAEYVPKKET